MGDPGRGASSTITESRTQSTSRRSYSAKSGGKFASTQSAQPMRMPSTSKTTGSLPGVYR
ncbi:hypothetical protein B9S64_32215 [Streptomyces sp. SM18]|nr:hypothetical protein B9S64_32215 [Streptomyces sp. SM18]